MESRLGDGASISAKGFSMVEITIALGIVAFALVMLIALLPLGMKSNQISAEETRAVCILSALEADLRNSRPGTGNSQSRLFGLTLPYKLDSASNYIFNTVSPAATLDAGITTALDDAEKPVGVTVVPRPPFQATVLYSSVPEPDSKAPLRARLVVNWPSLPGGSIDDLTDPSTVRGFVEAFVSFPAP